MFCSGVPEKVVAEISGHKSVKALRQYEIVLNSCKLLVNQFHVCRWILKNSATNCETTTDDYVEAESVAED